MSDADFDPEDLSEDQYVGVGEYDRYVKRHDTNAHGDPIVVLTDDDGVAEYSYSYPHLRMMHDDDHLSVPDDPDDIEETPVCDHCRSNMDEPVGGERGAYCSPQCYYAEEVDGPEAHDSDIDIRECPGCYGDHLTDDIMVVVESDADIATVRMHDHTPSGMYDPLTDAAERALYDEYEGGLTLEELGTPVGETIGWAAIDEDAGEVVHVELGI